MISSVKRFNTGGNLFQGCLDAGLVVAWVEESMFRSSTTSGPSLEGLPPFGFLRRSILSAATAMLALTFSGVAADVDYLKSVKPVLTAHCVSCHGEHNPKSGLRLDTAAAALKGGERGAAIIPGQPDRSLLVQLVEGSHAEISRMPYKKPALAATETELIRRWIKQGAVAPADEPSGSRGHWAFQSVRRPELPSVKHQDWVREPLDFFVLAGLESRGIRPSPEASPEVLLRRLSLDLTGLPPTPEERNLFLADRSPHAVEQLVDRLLASPHFGERWGRHWLDRARYADSNGYSIDAPRKMWRYRDWVIDAINADLPYDRFVTEQLAGDLIPNASLSQKIATGFHRNTQINEEGGIDPEQFRIESIFDRVHTTATVFQGLTLSCAQCHDHKFDPFSQTDYYRIFALFNDADEPTLEAPARGEVEARRSHDQRIQEAETKLIEFARKLEAEQGDWERTLGEKDRSVLKVEVRDALAKPAGSRNEKEIKLVRDAHRQQSADYRARAATVDRLKKSRPGLTTALVLSGRKEPRTTHRYVKGDFTRPAEVVEPGVPSLFPQPKLDGRRFNRLDFSAWLVSRENPLTARVAVNQIWQQLFGVGLVETENDFGLQGIPPSNPQLLDWLAADFMENGWSYKRIIRSIVLSASYRQSSNHRRELGDLDPSNRLISRQSRLRLEAEIIRDVALVASGTFAPVVGGPSVFPPQPEGVMDVGQVRRDWVSSQGAQKFRRGLYTHYWRATPHPSLSIFDAPDAFSSCTRRLRSNTPLQAMTLLNDPQFHELASTLGERLAASGGNSADAGIRHGFLVCVAREPGVSELQRMKQLFEKTRRESSEDSGTAVAAAWTAVARVLLNLDETMTRE